MIDLLRSRFAFQLSTIEGLVADVPEERMAEQPAPGMNSPAWLLGHLAWAADFVPALLGLDPAHGKDWAAKFSAKSRPTADRSAYPSKVALLDALRDAHSRASGALDRITPEALAAELPDATFRTIMPTVGDAVFHVLTTHEATHAGQLSAWRRVLGMPPLKANMFAD